MWNWGVSWKCSFQCKIKIQVSVKKIDIVTLSLVKLNRCLGMLKMKKFNIGIYGFVKILITGTTHVEYTS